MKGHVLVVHNNLGLASQLRNALFARQYTAHIASRGDDALSLLGRHRINAVVVSRDLPDHGLEWFFDRMSDLYPDLLDRVIVLTNDDMPEGVAAMVEAAAADIVTLPISAALLDQALSQQGVA